MKKSFLTHQEFVNKIKRDKIGVLSIQIGLLILIIAFWELFTYVGWLDTFEYSSPSRIIKTIGLLANSGTLFKHMGITLFECIVGFCISTLAGTLIAILLWWFEALRKILEPYIIVLNSLPKIALGPVIIIMVGTGIPAIVVMTILICIIITIISMLNSFISCDADKILLMRSMGANKWQILTKLVLPRSLLDFISVLKINVGLAWVGTIMGEYMTSSIGLGNQILYGQSIFQHDLVLTCTVILCVLAAGMYLIVALIEKVFKKKRNPQ